jgi:hypothetical protein
MLLQGNLRFLEIMKPGFLILGLRAMCALVDENPEMSIPEIVEVKSSTLCFSQMDDPDLILCLTYDLRPLP